MRGLAEDAATGGDVTSLAERGVLQGAPALFPAAP
jgi:hypothetical protein